MIKKPHPPLPSRKGASETPETLCCRDRGLPRPRESPAAAEKGTLWSGVKRGSHYPGCPSAAEKLGRSKKRAPETQQALELRPMWSRCRKLEKRARPLRGSRDSDPGRLPGAARRQGAAPRPGTGSPPTTAAAKGRPRPGTGTTAAAVAPRPTASNQRGRVLTVWRWYRVSLFYVNDTGSIGSRGRTVGIPYIYPSP